MVKALPGGEAFPLVAVLPVGPAPMGARASRGASLLEHGLELGGQRDPSQQVVSDGHHQHDAGRFDDAANGELVYVMAPPKLGVHAFGRSCPVLINRLRQGLLHTHPPRLHRGDIRRPGAARCRSVPLDVGTGAYTVTPS